MWRAVLCERRDPDEEGRGAAGGGAAGDRPDLSDAVGRAASLCSSFLLFSE